MKELIFKKLAENEFVELETEDSLLTIYFRKFFSTEKSYLFELNAKAIDSCKTKKTAINKISNYIQKGFVLSDI